MTGILRFFSRFWHSTTASAAAEYALILAVVATGIAVAAVALSGSIGNEITEQSGCISTPGEC